jgi:hypothetical protein
VNQFVVSVSLDHTIRLWELHSFRTVAVFPSWDASVNAHVSLLSYVKMNQKRKLNEEGAGDFLMLCSRRPFRWDHTDHRDKLSQFHEVWVMIMVSYIYFSQI